MLEEGKDCKDIVTQLYAVSKARGRAGFSIIASGREQCIVREDTTWIKKSLRSSCSPSPDLQGTTTPYRGSAPNCPPHGPQLAEPRPYPKRGEGLPGSRSDQTRQDKLLYGKFSASSRSCDSGRQPRPCDNRGANHHCLAPVVEADRGQLRSSSATTTSNETLASTASRASTIPSDREHLLAQSPRGLWRSP
jgi:hypothetical protein